MVKIEKKWKILNKKSSRIFIRSVLPIFINDILLLGALAATQFHVYKFSCFYIKKTFDQIVFCHHQIREIFTSINNK